MQNVFIQQETLVYDGSFEGFLCAVFEGIRLHLPVGRIQAEKRLVPEIFDELRAIHSEMDQAERVWKGIEKRGGAAVASMVRGAFLSELPGIETTLWHFLRKLFADPTGQFAHNMLDEHAHAVYSTARKVMGEVHRFLGFVRFQKSPQGQMFAVIDPAYNIVEMLASHFSARYPNLPWMIADSVRGLGIHYDGSNVQSFICNPRDLPSSAGASLGLAEASERDYQDLWNCYYDSINIVERKNTRLMVRQLPRKYWKYLPEKNR